MCRNVHLTPQIIQSQSCGGDSYRRIASDARPPWYRTTRLCRPRDGQIAGRGVPARGVYMLLEEENRLIERALYNAFMAWNERAKCDLFDLTHELNAAAARARRQWKERDSA